MTSTSAGAHVAGAPWRSRRRSARRRSDTRAAILGAGRRVCRAEPSGRDPLGYTGQRSRVRLGRGARPHGDIRAKRLLLDVAIANSDRDPRVHSTIGKLEMKSGTGRRSRSGRSRPARRGGAADRRANTTDCTARRRVDRRRLPIDVVADGARSVSHPILAGKSPPTGSARSRPAADGKSTPSR